MIRVKFIHPFEGNAAGSESEVPEGKAQRLIVAGIAEEVLPPGTDPAGRIRLALGQKPKGFRGPQLEQLLCEVFAGDIVSCCLAAAEPDEKINELLKGCGSHPPTRRVAIQADDAHHLLEKMAAVPEPAPSPEPNP